MHMYRETSLTQHLGENVHSFYCCSHRNVDLPNIGSQNLNRKKRTNGLELQVIKVNSMNETHYTDIIYTLYYHFTNIIGLKRNEFVFNKIFDQTLRQQIFIFSKYVLFYCCCLPSSKYVIEYQKQHSEKKNQSTLRFCIHSRHDKTNNNNIFRF